MEGLILGVIHGFCFLKLFFMALKSLHVALPTTLYAKCKEKYCCGNVTPGAYEHCEATLTEPVHNIWMQSLRRNI